MALEQSILAEQVRAGVVLREGGPGSGVTEFACSAGLHGLVQSFYDGLPPVMQLCDAIAIARHGGSWWW
jgi:hypothetical protein